MAGTVQKNRDQTLRYPLKRIENTDDWFQIEIIDYSIKQDLSGFNLEKPGSIISGGLTPIGNQLQKVSALGTIYLPMPQNIQDMNAVGWGDDSLNTLAAAGLNFAKGTIGSPELISGFVDRLKSVATGAAGAAGPLQTLAQNFFASQAVNALGANTSLDGVLARTTGQIVNPNMELLFKSVTLRSFNFEWDLIPRSDTESAAVWEIIKTLKVNMAPKRETASNAPNGGRPSSGLFIKSPNVFRLKYMSGSDQHPFLHSFKPCALLQMGVNYTGNGSYATYYDKTPVHLKLSLAFQELNPIYAEDYYPENEIAQGITGGVGY